MHKVVCIESFLFYTLNKIYYTNDVDYNFIKNGCDDGGGKILGDDNDYHPIKLKSFMCFFDYKKKLVKQRFNQ